MPKAPESASLREKAIVEIRRRILSGEYPVDMPLSEYKISDDLGVSRTPIREALRELARSGLVEILPKRGVFIRKPTPTDVLEIFQIREILEGAASRIAAGAMEASARTALRSDHERSKTLAAAGKSKDAYNAAILLHQHILHACNNSRIVQFLHMLDDQVHILGLMTLAAPGRLQEALNEHEAIVAAVENSDGERAERLMKDHLRRDSEVALQRLVPARY